MKIKRTNYCGELNESFCGKTVSLSGWVQKQRDLGSLIFVDLRDRTGIVQLTFDETSAKEVFDAAFKVRTEYVISVTGEVRERSNKNPSIPTGNVEVLVTEIEVLAQAQTPPFEIVENSKANEELRLKYRYLDLRRPELQKNIQLRHKIVKTARDYFYDNGFIEIETPILIKSTPEGARDYLVPSRLHKGSFYALPQSPQLYKQLCMVAGFDRYVQFARCFRDEDGRADRQPEFTQIDLEMSFIELDDLIKIVEGLMQRLYSEVLGIELPQVFPRYTYREVMEKYGSDKPDIRFGMEIKDLTATVKNSSFSVFKDSAESGAVCGIVLEGYADSLTRKDIDRFADYAKGCGAGGLAWLKRGEQLSSSFAKFLTEDELEAIYNASGCSQGDILLIIAGKNRGKVLSQLGQLRIEAANRLQIKREGNSFLWVVDMPFFEYDDESGEWLAMHHPFTAILDECLNSLENDKANVRAKACDLVLNGIELLSGSIRITDPVFQNKIFRMLGLSEEDAKKKFGFLLEAYKYGAPPHGGMGIGLDRLVMQMIGCESLRDVVAFPKMQNASEPMSEAPAEVPENALNELGIKIIGD